MANDLNFVFLWMQRELLASQTLSDMASKGRKQEEASMNQQNTPMSEIPKEEEQQEAGCSSDEKKPRRKEITRDSWSQYIPPSLSTCTTLETTNITEKTVLANPNGPKLVGDEMLDIAHALEDLHCEAGKKRTPISIMEAPTAPKPKKRRRRRHEIARNFKCTMNSCTKSYGSEGALKTHVRLKHTEGSDKRRDREKMPTPWTSSMAGAGASLLIPQLPNAFKSLAGDSPPMPPRMIPNFGIEFQPHQRITMHPNHELRLPPPNFGQGEPPQTSELPPLNLLFQTPRLTTI